MRTLFAHVRRNAVAYVALFVALGGTSYAAIRLPAGSVNNRVIANRTITPGKLNTSAAHSFGGYVRDWASVSAAGQVVASNRRAVNLSADAGAGAYGIAWVTGKAGHSTDPIQRCVPEVTAQESLAISPPIPGAFATAAIDRSGAVGVATYNASGVETPEPFYVVVVC
jgi:hypothetical protein